MSMFNSSKQRDCISFFYFANKGANRTNMTEIFFDGLRLHAGSRSRRLNNLALTTRMAWPHPGHADTQPRNQALSYNLITDPASPRELVAG